MTAKSSIHGVSQFTTVGQFTKGIAFQFIEKNAFAKPCESVFSYSVLSAITGSFFAAAEAGTSPLIEVKITLITIMATALPIGREASVEIPVRLPSNKLMNSEAK